MEEQVSLHAHAHACNDAHPHFWRCGLKWARCQPAAQSCLMEFVGRRQFCSSGQWIHSPCLPLDLCFRMPRTALLQLGF